MRIAVSSTGPDLSDLVDPRFSKCRYYIIIDTEARETKAIENAAAYVCVLRDTTTGKHGGRTGDRRRVDGAYRTESGRNPPGRRSENIHGGIRKNQRRR